MIKISIFTVAALVLMSQAEAATYKWVDSKGRVHYSDSPPQGQDFETLKQPRFAPPSQEAQQRLQKLIASQEEAQKARQSKVAEGKNLAAQKEARAKGCAQVREQITMFEGRPARRITTTNEDGSLRRMNEDEKQARLSELRKQAADLCDE